MAATPYSTGGGGIVLEHRYGAFVLAHVLSGAPLYELDGVTAPTAVRFQTSAESAVDDLVIRGVRPDGTERTATVAVRRDPTAIRSSDKTRSLITRFLSVLDLRMDEI